MGYGDRLARRRCGSIKSGFVYSIQGTRACRTLPVAVDDDAIGLARTCADIQGSAGKTQREGSRHLRFSGLPAAAKRGYSDLPCESRACREDQAPHIEFTREICRRFNHIYGKEAGFEEKAQAAIKKLGSKKSRLYIELRNRYQEQGDEQALAEAKSLLEEQQNLSMGDQERLYGYLEGGGKMILCEPETLLTKASRMPGLDGQKMSKSYNNTISLREDADSVRKKIRTMPTNPARVRRTDPGNPDVCPVWQFHLVYSDDEIRNWVQQGCRSASIGCLDCKSPVIDKVLAEQEPMHDRARMYEEDPVLVRNIIADGCEKANQLAEETMRDIRAAMGLDYS